MKVLTAIFLTFLFALSVFAQTQAEIIVPMTYLRKSPNPVAEKIETVQRGDKVTLEKKEKKDNWYFVAASNGKKGWVSENTIRPLNGEVMPKNETPTASEKPKATPTPRIAIFGNPKEPKKTEEITRPRISQTKEPAKTVPTPKPTPTAVSTENVAVKPVPTPSPTPNPNDPVEDNEVLKIETEEVSLNVRVVDDKNRSVNNLKESQFKIYEDDVLQPITSFVTTQVPIVNALVIDNSRSLRTQLTKVIEAGKIIVGANQTKDVSTVFRFVSANKIEVVQDFTSNKNSLNNALENLFVEGGQTAIIDAVYQATQKVEQYQTSQKPEDVKVRALILVSDGDDRSSTKTEQQLFQLLRASQVQIYAIGFVNNLAKEPDPTGVSRQEKAKAFLTRLSTETGGKVYFPNSPEELTAIAAEISNDLRTQYVISYSPTNDSRDGNFRQIKVVTESGNKAITRSGRTSAPKEKP